VRREMGQLIETSPSSNRSIGPSSPIAYGLSASLQKEENTIANQTAALNQD